MKENWVLCFIFTAFFRFLCFIGAQGAGESGVGFRGFWVQHLSVVRILLSNHHQFHWDVMFRESPYHWNVGLMILQIKCKAESCLHRHLSHLGLLWSFIQSYPAPLVQLQYWAGEPNWASSGSYINLQYTAQWDTSDRCIVVRGTTAYSEELLYLYCQSRHMLSPAWCIIVSWS